MRRGDIVGVDLDPARGTEAAKRRPAVVVSNDRANGAAMQLRRGVVTVVPLTTNVRLVLPFQVPVEGGASGLLHDAKAQAEQVRSVDVGRISGVVGRVPAATMEAIDEALRLHLAL